MSYTMTIESPEKAAWFEQRRSKLSQARLGELFVAFLMERRSEIFEDDFSCFAGRWTNEEADSFDELTKRTIDHHMRALVSLGVEVVDIGENGIA